MHTIHYALNQDYRNSLNIYNVDKAYNVMVVGAAVGCFLVILGLAIYLHEDFYRKRFYGRIYVD